jgi:hypothetical protein
MNYDPLCGFLSAFGGAMLLYGFRLAVEYRNDPDQWAWSGWRDLLAQVGISLTITVITFLTLWKGIETGPPECNLAWYPYIKACTEAMMLEMIVHSIGGNHRSRRHHRKQETSKREGREESENCGRTFHADEPVVGPLVAAQGGKPVSKPEDVSVKMRSVAHPLQNRVSQ